MPRIIQIIVNCPIYKISRIHIRNLFTSINRFTEISSFNRTFFKQGFFRFKARQNGTVNNIFQFQPYQVRNRRNGFNQCTVVALDIRLIIKHNHFRLNGLLQPKISGRSWDIQFTQRISHPIIIERRLVGLSKVDLIKNFNNCIIKHRQIRLIHRIIGFGNFTVFNHTLGKISNFGHNNPIRLLGVFNRRQNICFRVVFQCHRQQNRIV